MNKLTRLKNCDHKCYPLDTLEQVINFKLPPAEQSLIDEFCVELRPRHTLPGPRVIVAHDYKGGYLNDACMKGSSSSDEFRFLSWHLIDTFVYFSHQLITIPPIPWICSAHRNGVEILGTIITEHESGHSFLESVLADVANVQQFARSAARLMAAFKFDGWLLNVENSVRPALMPNLVELVKRLNEECKLANSSAKVIWYDAVTYPSGTLAWQDELNDRNRIFFDHCDGIFLNYCWRTRHLINSLRLAGQRKDDVYVGIDVFGRGCYASGFRTHLAVEFVRKFQLSIALFAPGWIHEVIQRNSVVEFHENNARFWNSLRLPVRHLPTELPIESFFCQGFGRKYFEFGECVQQADWTNQLLQEPQANCSQLQRIDCADALIGGSCLLLGDLSQPIFRLRAKWTGDLFVLLAFKHKTSDAAFQPDRGLLVLGHGANSNSNSIALGSALKLSDLNRADCPRFYDQAKSFQENVKNGWQIFMARLKPPENRRCSDCRPKECPGAAQCAKCRADEFLEKLYLHADLQSAKDSIQLKIGYLGVF